MSMRHPVIIDRGEKKAEFGCRFLCQSRKDSLMAYAGVTPESAYESWAKSTRAGRWHKHKAGFRADFVRKGDTHE